MKYINKQVENIVKLDANKLFTWYEDKSAHAILFTMKILK